MTMYMGDLHFSSSAKQTKAKAKLVQTHTTKQLKLTLLQSRLTNLLPNANPKILRK